MHISFRLTRTNNMNSILILDVGSRKSVSLVAQMVKHLPTMRETWVRSLGWEDLLEKGKGTHSSILAWRIPWTVCPWDCKESNMTEPLSLSLSVYQLPRYRHWGEYLQQIWLWKAGFLSIERAPLYWFSKNKHFNAIFKWI